MSPRPVLFFHSSSGRYGADRQLHLIATGLDRSRYEPIVLLPSVGPLAVDLRDAGVKVIVRESAMLSPELATPRGLTTAIGAAARDAPALRALLCRLGVSIVHSNTSVVLGGAAAAASARIPHIWHVREIHWRFGRLWPRYRLMLSKSRALPCVSHAVAEQFTADDPARVIPDGLAVDRPRVPRERAREALGLPQTAPTIALVGRISESKGQDVLVRALAHPALRERGVTGVIAGEPWPGTVGHRAAVLRLAAELAVEDRLRLIGFREGVEAVYDAADIVVVPSTKPDPLPGPAIEAGAAGRAVIASATGGLPEIITDGQTGRLVAPGDSAALSRSVAELIDDPSERERLGAAAAEDIRARFAPRRLIDAIHGLYDTVLDGW